MTHQENGAIPTLDDASNRRGSEAGQTPSRGALEGETNTNPGLTMGRIRRRIAWDPTEKNVKDLGVRIKGATS